MIRTSRTLMLSLLAALLIALPVRSETPIPIDPATILEQRRQDALKINALVASIELQRQELKKLNARLESTRDASDRATLEQEQQAQQERLAKLKKSLEQIAIGGLDLSVLSDEPPQQVEWQVEVQQILLPVLASMRELTAKPRRIEALRTEISQNRERLEVVDKALRASQELSGLPLSEQARESLDRINEKWRTQQAELAQSLDLARIQLSSLTEEKVAWREELSDLFNDFFRQRGLTLLLALAAGILVWVGMHLLLYFYERVLRRRRGPRSRTRLRLAEFVHTGVTLALVIAAVVAVFYLRSDILLFTLSVILIVFLLITARQYLPRFIKEARLLLNIGSVREGERVLLEGVPYEVKSINVYCLFRNPALRGIRRLPLSALEGMVSRPSIGEDESWFPTEADDFVLLPDGNLAQVEKQTVDFVQLQLLGTPVTVPVADFMGQGVRNLSRQGFALVVTFGVDYRHQALALREVPAAFEAGVRRMLSQGELGRQLLELVADFSAAAASSLDIRVYARLDGSAAGQYFAIRRLIQRACVHVCNEEGWVIPFAQVTVHQGEGFERLAARV